eukprot:NODE_1273_length_1496_cov_14.818936_g1058_i0.p1 GENE.NODE_1273_length_1496_cov_14.818936_g1058_i0~~NODE_1273_length_1496_cov_14.818936_g1058_i0.p1  ORF type:complete len:434 (+),score=31.17 NODE_1273_length_1496_cov_14.818936_g1058_i0:170-1471(+)
MESPAVSLCPPAVSPSLQAGQGLVPLPSSARPSWSLLLWVTTWCLLVLSLPIIDAQYTPSQTFSIAGVASDNSAYIFSSPPGSDPELSVMRGTVIRFSFQVPQPAHPLFIRTALASTGIQNFNNYGSTVQSGGVSNNGATSGFIDIQIPSNEPLNYIYYQCANHPAMAGRIILQGGSFFPTLPQVTGIFPPASGGGFLVIGGDTRDWIFQTFGADPTLTMKKGTVSTFTIIQQPSHTFWIRTARSAVVDNSLNNAYANVINNGASEGVITLSVPSSDPRLVLYYQCGNHPDMWGQIFLSDPGPETVPSIPNLLPLFPSAPSSADSDDPLPGSALVAIVVLSIVAACFIILFCIVCLVLLVNLATGGRKKKDVEAAPKDDSVSCSDCSTVDTRPRSPRHHPPRRYEHYVPDDCDLCDGPTVPSAVRPAAVYYSQ